MKDQTRLIHTIGSPDKETGSMVAPIHLSTIFAMQKPSSHGGFQYGRIRNPTRQILEDTLAHLHNANHAAVFSSGSAAMTAILATLKQGDNVACHDVVYEGTLRLLKRVFEKFGVTVRFTDFKQRTVVPNIFLAKTKLVWIESPTNPLLDLLDIAHIADLAHHHGALLVVDNTFATPVLQQPLALGADIVVESLTKGINGHSDAIGGVIATNNSEFFSSITFLQHTMGAVLSPFDSFLILRGIKTLPIRIKQQQENAKRIAEWLQSQAVILTIHFPGLNNPSEAQLLNRQMLGPGSLISFNLRQEKITPSKFLSKLKLISVAHSLGGPETLIQQPTTMMDLSFTAKQMNRLEINDGFFRLSVGLEDCSDIISDLQQALAPDKKI